MSRRKSVKDLWRKTQFERTRLGPINYGHCWNGSRTWTAESYESLRPLLAPRMLHLIGADDRRLRRYPMGMGWRAPPFAMSYGKWTRACATPPIMQIVCEEAALYSCNYAANIAHPDRITGYWTCDAIELSWFTNIWEKYFSKTVT